MRSVGHLCGCGRSDTPTRATHRDADVDDDDDDDVRASTTTTTTTRDAVQSSRVRVGVRRRGGARRGGGAAARRVDATRDVTGAVVT